MGLFEHFPYSNFHDLNLNWIIGKIKNIEQITADVAEQSAAAVQSAADAAESAEQAAGSAEAAAGSAQEAAETVEPFTSTVTEIRARMNAFVQQHSGPADETVLYSSDTPVFSGSIEPSESISDYQNIKFVWRHRNDICEQEFKLTGSEGQNFYLRDCLGAYGAGNSATWEMCQIAMVLQSTGELQFTEATVIDNLQYNDGPVDNTMNTGILQVIGIRNVADTEVVDARVGADNTIYPTLEDRLNAEYSALNNTIQSIEGGVLSNDVKQALLNCFARVAWIGSDGQNYYDALESALYPPADLVSISAVYTQSGAVYESDTLESLESDLVVTALYSDSTTATVTTYELSGTLTEGTSVITVAYGGKTTTFNVIVSPAAHYLDAVLTYEEGHTITASNGDVWTYDSTLNYYTTQSNVLFKKLVCYFDETKSSGNLWGRGQSNTEGRMFECWLGGVKQIGYRLYNTRHPASGSFATASPVTFDNGTTYDANGNILDTYPVADLSFNCLGGRNGGTMTHALTRIVADI